MGKSALPDLDDSVAVVAHLLKSWEWTKPEAAEASAKMLLGAIGSAGYAVVPREHEIGWVIERWVNNTLHYWTGRGTPPFEDDHGQAVRFAREEDAMRVLSWVCGSQGRVAEHMWLTNPRGGVVKSQRHAAVGPEPTLNTRQPEVVPGPLDAATAGNPPSLAATHAVVPRDLGEFVSKIYTEIDKRWPDNEIGPRELLAVWEAIQAATAGENPPSHGGQADDAEER